MCPQCGRRRDDCACRKSPRARARDQGPGVARVGRESKGRRGKTVTTIAGLGLPQEQLLSLAGERKRGGGNGGSVKGDVIEIQGEHCEVLMAELEARGYCVKSAV